MNKGLIALAFGGLAIGMTEFTMMGILEVIANDLQISIPKAGNFIAFYALGVVVGAPVLVLFSGKYPPKKVLLFLMLLFFVFNALFSVAPEYYTLLIARFCSGLPHGAFFGVGTVVAARLAKPGKAAQAISIMFTGMTIANLAGVPLGTYLGQEFSWRLTYGIISLLGLLTILAIHFWLPNLENTSKDSNMFNQLNFFKTKAAWLLIAIISIGTGGLFAWISYISPMVTKVSGLAESQVPVIMILIGLGMFFGNILGGKVSDSVSPTKAAIASFSTMALILIVVYFTAHNSTMAYVMAFITGMIAFTIGPPLQMMLITAGKGSETLAAAAGQASFNLGNTFGAFFGGIPISMGFAYNSPPLIGVGMATIGALLSVVFLFRFINKE